MRFSFRYSVSTAIGGAFLAGISLGVVGTGIAATLFGSDVFTDVERNAYYDEAIGELYSDGIIKGYDSTHFGPNDYVTRGQVAVMLQRFRDDLNGVARSSSSSRAGSSRSSSSTSATTSANPKGAFRFTASALSVSETKSTVLVGVVRTGGNQGSVSVRYAITGNTATASEDFVATSGTLQFDDGETSKTFTITIRDDSTGEGNETATIELSDPSNGSELGTPSSITLTIIDNEASSSTSSSSSSSSNGQTSSSNPNGTLNFSAASYAVNENNGTLTITVARSGGTNGSVNVNYATANGTASSGTDYSATSGTLTFNSGESSKSFTIAITDDTNIDGSKSFSVSISSPTGGATLGNTKTASVTIYDNESVSTGSGSFRFSKSNYDVSEADGYAEVIVQRTGGAQGTVSVNYATLSGTAYSGADYTTTSGTLTFTNGEASKVISIPIVKDNDSDAGELFYINLSNPSSSTTLGSPESATVTIY